jgi:hypothetical protein
LTVPRESDIPAGLMRLSRMTIKEGALQTQQ